MNIAPREEVVPLTPQAFHVLLALADRPMYGYGLTQQCKADAGTSLYFDHGSTYRTLRRLKSMMYVRDNYEMYGKGSAHARRYLSLTSTGQMVLEFECKRYQAAATLGRQRLAVLKRRQTETSIA